MPTKEKDVIILDEDDDASDPIVKAPLSACLGGVTMTRTSQDPHHQQSSHAGFKDTSIASSHSALQNPSVGDPTSSQPSDELFQALPGARYERGFSYSGNRQPPQSLPHSPLKELSKAYSLTNSLKPPYFAAPSWSFTAAVASNTEFQTPPKPSHATPRRGGKESAGAHMTPTRSSSSSHGPRLLTRPMMTNLIDDDDSADEEDLALWMAQDAEDEMNRSSQTGSDLKAETSRRSSTIIPRNPPIISPFVKLDSFTYNGIPLAEKVYVELEDRDFLRVVHIIQDTSTSEVTLRGWKFRRTKELNGVIEKKLNEVCWILHIDDDDPRDPKLQGMDTVPVHNIIKRRRIRLTNQSFPALSWREDGEKGKPEPIETVENDRVLVCRFKYLCFYANAKARTAYEWHEKGFHRLREDECDQRPDNKMKDGDLRSIWRGYTVPGGSQEGWLPGEREFLRQEDVSHRGITSRASLKAPSGPDFPMGDPMKRGSVGSLVTEIDLQRSSDRASQSLNVGSNNPVHTDPVARSTNAVAEAPRSSTSHSREQRRGGQKPRFNFSGFNGLPVVSSDCDTDDDAAVSALRRGLRRSSIESRKFMDRSPRIVEIDAHVKTSSSSGTFENRYKGRVTSRYYPLPRLARRKRSADISLGSPIRPTKKTDRGLRVESNQAELRNMDDGRDSRMLSRNIKYSHQASAFSDSDRTLGRSQSPDSVGEVYTPSGSRGYKTPINGLLTPVSRRMDSAPRRSSGINLLPSMGGSTEDPQPSLPLSRTAGSSVTDKTQAYRTTEEEDDIVDLTGPQANPHGNSSRGQSSLVGQSDPLHAQPVLSSHLNKTSSSRKKSFQPTATQPPFNAKHYREPAETRQKLNAIDLGPLPATPGSSQASSLPSAPSFKVPAGPSSRHTERSRQQNQNKPIKSPALKANQRRYTFGDCFCGAGGMSRGAVSAGLRVGWGFDFDLAACQSYQMNFFRTPIYNVRADQFSEAKGDHKVDICHLSPPCQFFSSAHTVQGKDDDMNTASLFAIFNLLEKAKPRIVTLEQTSGLIQRHPIFFNTVINMFTSRGFSVRWKVMNCADFGLPQRRTRLFVIASCPGEALPPFPTPTHSSNPEKTGLKAWTTINETIARIPHGWANHDIHLAKEQDKPPQPGDTIATCVTTSGGGLIHPSGKRAFTHREFACLQSFPLGHKFGASGVKKQIGNGVPPTIAKIILETVKNALLRADGLL